VALIGSDPENREIWRIAEFALYLRFEFRFHIIALPVSNDRPAIAIAPPDRTPNNTDQDRAKSQSQADASAALE